jgi:hypothetical protein
VDEMKLVKSVGRVAWVMMLVVFVGPGVEINE